MKSLFFWFATVAAVGVIALKGYNAMGCAYMACMSLFCMMCLCIAEMYKKKEDEPYIDTKD